MKKYVIWVSERGTKCYIKIDNNGVPYATANILEASVMPNRAVAQSIVCAIKPAIKKQGFNVNIGFECI